MRGKILKAMCVIALVSITPALSVDEVSDCNLPKQMILEDNIMALAISNEVSTSFVRESTELLSEAKAITEEEWKSILNMELKDWQLTSSSNVRFKRMINKIPENAKVLDLGCHYGEFSLFGAPNRPDISIVGVDFSENCLEKTSSSFKALINLPIKSIISSP